MEIRVIWLVESMAMGEPLAVSLVEPEKKWMATGCMEINTEEQTAEILYYVESSDPHVSVWIENIHYAQENGQFQITQEKINQFADGPDAKTDGIASADEFDTAYAQGISDTQMDYCINGMGEVLNKNMVPIGCIG